MKPTEEYEYLIVDSEDLSHIYEDTLSTREAAREAKREWKTVAPNAVILQVKINKEYNIVR